MSQDDPTEDRVNEVIGILAAGVRRLLEQRGQAPSEDRGAPGTDDERASRPDDPGDSIRLAMSGGQRPHGAMVDAAEHDRR
jgi:hypothetical protein